MRAASGGWEALAKMSETLTGEWEKPKSASGKLEHEYFFPAAGYLAVLFGRESTEITFPL
jgi:hypothetical protein